LFTLRTTIPCDWKERGVIATYSKNNLSNHRIHSIACSAALRVTRNVHQKIIKKNAAKEHKGLKDSKLWKTDFSEIYAFFSAKNLPKFGKRIPTGLQDREIEILSLLLSRQKNIN